MLHGSETWLARKQNELALQWAEMRMAGWMCGIKLRPLSSDRQHLSCDVCLEVRGEIIRTALIYIVY